MNLSLGSLSNLLNTNPHSAADAASASAGSSAHMNAAAQILDSLSAGQMISGIVRSSDGAQIILDLGGGNQVQARLDGGMDVAVGKNLTFEVKSNSAGKLMLSPLFTNLSASQSAGVSALSAASLPINQTTITMVNSMMDEGMSIDRNSLLNMAKQAAKFDAGSVDTVVRLTAMGMEVNDTNVNQYEAAQNLQHRILDQTSQLGGEIRELLSQLESSTDSIRDGLRFMQGLLEELPFAESENMISGESGETVSGKLSAEAQNPMSAAEEGALNAESELMQEGGASGAPIAELRGEVRILLDYLESQLSGAANAAEGAENGVPGASGTNDGTATMLSGMEHEAASDAGALGQKTIAGLDENRAAFLKESFRNISEEFSGRLKELLQREWAMDAKDFSDKGKVKEFYKHIEQESSVIKNALAGIDKMDSPAAKVVQNVQQNLQFMENVNQMIPYLQIPLKTAMNNAHGELYVYSRGKGKASEDGSSSALLHLEMEHLGNMDVYIKLKDRNVSTQFTLENEAALDFLADHMDLLTARLEKRGYHTETSAKLREDRSEDSVMEKIRGISHKENMIAYTSFDVRA